jgi:hypothetical protein
VKNSSFRDIVLSALALFAVTLASGSSSTVNAQGWEDRAVGQAQHAVRQRIIAREGGNSVTVAFNTDAQTDVKPRNAVRVHGTGTFTHNNNSRSNNTRNNDWWSRGGRSRDFTYEATVSRSRSGSVSGVSYALAGWSGDARDNNRRDNDRRDNNDRDNNRGGFGAAVRPEGLVSYSGPIMNRHSDKALDVTERSNRDGANIQQWSYADQPNQNWDVIDLGNGESAIISRQSGRAITAQGGRDNNGANIIQQSWRGSPQQRWRLEQVGGSYYRIVSVDNGKCLDVTERGKQDGANIQLWEYSNNANQQWRLRR